MTFACVSSSLKKKTSLQKKRSLLYSQQSAHSAKQEGNTQQPEKWMHSFLHPKGFCLIRLSLCHLLAVLCFGTRPADGFFLWGRSRVIKELYIFGEAQQRNQQKCQDCWSNKQGNKPQGQKRF